MGNNIAKCLPRVCVYMQRDNILRAAKNLKNAGRPASNVCIKNDVHPAVRKEAARLQRREREEKEKAENVRVNIT